MFSLPYVTQQFINAIILGSIYALVAIGLSMVYGILRLINFAHGDILMIGAYTGLFLLTIYKAPFAVVLIVPMVVGGLIGVIVERVAYRPLRKAPEVALLITSLAVSMFIENLAIMVLSPRPRRFLIPSFLSRSHFYGAINFRNIDVLIVLLTIILVIVLTMFVKKTKVGIAMRATAESINTSYLMGINVNNIIMLTFAIGSLLAGVAGMMFASKYGRIEPFMGFLPGLKAFVASVIGGIGSLPGAVVGGYILGFAEIFFVGFLPPQLSGYRDGFVFLLLIIVLLIKPSGIFGQAEKREV